MSVIICTIKRRGGSFVHLFGTEYHFRPHPMTSEHVAEVEDPAHIDRLLAIPATYKLHPTLETLTDVAPSDFTHRSITTDDRIADALMQVPNPQAVGVESGATTNPLAAFEPSAAVAADPAATATDPAATAGDPAATAGDPAATAESKPLDAMSDDELMDAYEAQEGRRPPANIKRETMIAALKPKSDV